MTASRFGRYTLFGCAAAAMLAGCGASQPPIGAPGAMAQSPAIAAHAERSGSWMLPEAKGKDLLFVAEGGIDSAEGDVLVFTLKGGKLVGEVRQASPQGECADMEGDVFVPSSVGDKVVVYGHDDAVKRILMTPYDDSFSCSVDQTTRNLAVTRYDYFGGGFVSIYQRARGSATIYTSPSFRSFSFCGYDDSGNLFVDARSSSEAFVLGELPKGGTSINVVTLNSTINSPGQVQWDGKYLAIADASTDSISQFSISGSRALLKSKTILRGVGNGWVFSDFWIQGSLVVASASRVFNGYPNSQIRYYRYPAGGKPTRRFRRDPNGEFGVAVSLARH